MSDSRAIPRVGDVVLIEGHKLQEANLLGILKGTDGFTADSEKIFYKVRPLGLFSRARWISEYHLRGIITFGESR